MMSNRVRQAAAYAFAAAALSTSVVGAASGTAHAGVSSGANTADTWQGCPEGAVCIYTGDSWNGGNPEHIYWSYGAHKLYDEYGKNRVYNNQTGDATVSFCTGSDGTNCGSTIHADHYGGRDLTPINSIRLSP